MRNPSTLDCEWNKAFNIHKYLDIKNVCINNTKMIFYDGTEISEDIDVNP